MFRNEMFRNFKHTQILEEKIRNIWVNHRADVMRMK